MNIKQLIYVYFFFVFVVIKSASNINTDMTAILAINAILDDPRSLLSLAVEAKPKQNKLAFKILEFDSDEDENLLQKMRSLFGLNFFGLLGTESFSTFDSKYKKLKDSRSGLKCLVILNEITNEPWGMCFYYLCSKSELPIGKENKKFAEIEYLVIDKKYRKLGLGPMMLQIVENECRQAGYDYTYLESLNDRLREFYKTLGYYQDLDFYLGRTRLIKKL